MNRLAYPLTVLMLTAGCAAQDKDPVEIVAASWNVQRQSAVKVAPVTNSTQRELTADDKYYARDRRAQQVRGAAPDPSEMTVDGRHAALDKAVDGANTPKVEDKLGYRYNATFVNNTRDEVDVIFWEFRFIEIANPLNVVRRQFLCSADMKPGVKKELSIFSMFGPSDSISPASLDPSVGKLFEQQVYLNRVEFKDNAIIQRQDWKYADVKKAVERATSTPWGKEVCRSL
ncbi:MAG TPA: hypothetical protein VL501_04425 [Pyrinomonadaceae bacterium]|nr:hypothetical protein [Pyrinomonadaceae bacterium]